MKNKKAQISEILTMPEATIIIIFLLIVFIAISLLITSGASKYSEKESIKISSKESALVSLQAYLQTPVDVEIDGATKNIKMADLIKLAVKNEIYQSVLKEKTKEIFYPIYGDNYFIHLSSPLLEIVSTSAGISDFYIAEIAIPSDKPIIIIMGVIK